jgi:hypothetical protein
LFSAARHCFQPRVIVFERASLFLTARHYFLTARHYFLTARHCF